MDDDDIPERAIRFMEMLIKDPLRIVRIADAQLAEDGPVPARWDEQQRYFCKTNDAFDRAWKEYQEQGPLGPHPFPEKARTLGDPLTVARAAKRYFAALESASWSRH